MVRLKEATPRITVRLYKTITRSNAGELVAVSERYKGQTDFIDLSDYIGDGSTIRTSKSVREPAGAFSITIADRPQVSTGLVASEIESVYGLVEPMDIIEIRIWNGVGRAPEVFPIVMRGFVSEVQRLQTMGQTGQPQRQVVISGQDYGKIWQMYQVIFLAAYANGKSLLSNFELNELFGIDVMNVMAASEFVRTMIDKVINPHLDTFIPETLRVPRMLKTEDMFVKYGKVNNSFHHQQGSIYEILRTHGDVGTWNELYVEDREDGVHVVYRPIPALHLAPGNPASARKIQDDAPDPVYCEIPDHDVQSLSVARTDANVANFYWVTGARMNIIGDQDRKLLSIPSNDARVSTDDYPNTDVRYYGVRPMYAETQQGDVNIKTFTSGLLIKEHSQREAEMEEWINRRRRQMLEINRDNVVFERGSARVKGGPVHENGNLLRAGDYARFAMGNLTWDAYVTQIDHEYTPYQSYTTTVLFERGEGFAARALMEGGAESPWLAEQAMRAGK